MMRTKITEHYTSTRYPGIGEARRARDSRAKSLRLAGYRVTCRKVSFEDLARGEDYTLAIHLDGDEGPRGFDLDLLTAKGAK